MREGSCRQLRKIGLNFFEFLILSQIQPYDLRCMQEPRMNPTEGNPG